MDKSGSEKTFSSDVYSLGLVMWCFDTRRFPFVEKSHAAIIYQCVENHLRPVVPSGGGPLLQAYRNTYQECWHPLRDERPKLEEVTRRINEITDDMFELESVPLMSHGSFPPALHSASTCQLSSSPKSSPGDVFHSAHSSVSCLAHISCQPSPTPPDLCDNTPVFMERAPAAVTGPTVARPADNRSPSSLWPPSLCRTAGGRHPSPTPLQLCQSVPDLQRMAPATDLLAVPPRRLPSLSVPAAVWTFLIQQLPVLRRAARFLPLLPTSASDHWLSPCRLCDSMPVWADEETTVVKSAGNNKSLSSPPTCPAPPPLHEHIPPEDITQGWFDSVGQGTYSGTVVACKGFHFHTDDALVRDLQLKVTGTWP